MRKTRLLQYLILSKVNRSSSDYFSAASVCVFGCHHLVAAYPITDDAFVGRELKEFTFIDDSLYARLSCSYDNILSKVAFIIIPILQ